MGMENFVYFAARAEESTCRQGLDVDVWTKLKFAIDERENPGLGTERFLGVAVDNGCGQHLDQSIPWPARAIEVATC